MGFDRMSKKRFLRFPTHRWLDRTEKDVDQENITYRWDNPGFQPQGDPVEANLGSFQRECLDCIRQHPRCQQAMLEKLTGREKGQISKAVAKLVERGLVQRADDGLLIAL